MRTLPVADRMIELFGHRPTDEGRKACVADELLSLATESDFMSIRVAGCDEDVGVVLECSDSSHVVGSREAGPLRVFRTLLARFAKMAEDETGTAPTAYGTRLHLERPSVSGPVRLSVEFANTSEIQYLAIAKTSQG